MTIPVFEPADCGPGGAGGIDSEGQILCDLDQNGELLGTALVVFNYENGVRTGTPLLLNPVTGEPYVVQGTLQVCPGDGASLAPMQFCFNSSTTVATPGRQYDLNLDIAPGYAVDSLLIDLVEYPMGVEWEVTDPDGSEFATRLQQAIQSQFRNGQTVTVTPPPPGVICGGKARFQIHIECRVVADAATLVQLTYDAGEDSIQNPAYNEDNGTLEERCVANDAFTRGGGTYRLLKRQDDGGTINCTGGANRGWETNDSLGEFEVWCNPGVTSSLQVVPTPRGTPVQEINANAPVGGGADTIWQTFQVTTAGMFTIEAVVGGRQRTEEIRVRLSTGDTDATGIGDRINELIVAPEVTNNANPWTVFERQVQLAPGTYTLSLTGPPTDATGGLFTDLRAYTTDPTRVDFVNDDETCEVDVTTNSTKCEWWQPQPVGGQIAGWERASDGLDLTNTEFWAQVPAPSCCGSDGTDGDAPDAALGNLSESYVVCGTVGGVQQNLQRVVITDQNGGAISAQFLGEDGAPVNPQSWQPGECNNRSPFEDAVICYTLEGDTTRRQGFRREAPNAVGQRVVSFLGDDGAVITPASWVPGPCPAPVPVDTELLTLCDEGNRETDGSPHQFLRRIVFDVDGMPISQTDLNYDGTVYEPVGPVVSCPGPDADLDVEEAVICYSTVAQPTLPRSGLMRTLYTDGEPTSRTFVDGGGEIINVADLQVWALGDCPEATLTTQIVCADGEPAVRVTEHRAGGVIVNERFERDGGVIIPAPAEWTAGECPGRDTEVVVLCDGGDIDDNADNVDTAPVQFLRRITYADDGTVVSQDDTTLAGVAYTPVGPVHECSLYSVSTESQVVCADGVEYLRTVSTLYYGLEPLNQQESFTVEGALVPVAPTPTGWAFGSCEPTGTAQYRTTASDSTANFTIGGADLVGWTLRARGRVDATYSLNGGPALPFDPGEAVSSGGIEEDGSTLADVVTVVVNAGTIRSTIARRI